MEETIFKMIEALNKTIGNAIMFDDQKDKDACIIRCVEMFQTIDALCDQFKIEMPDEGISANVYLDDYFGRDVLESSRTLFSVLTTALYN